MKFGTDTLLGSGKMPIYSGVNGVNFGITGCKNIQNCPDGRIMPHSAVLYLPRFFLLGCDILSSAGRT